MTTDTQQSAAAAPKPREDGPLKFRKRPVVIEAQQLTNEVAFRCLTQKERGPFGLWVNGTYHPERGEVYSAYIPIATPEGTMRADLGDWIIRGVKGELYPCKPDIFEATYEPVAAPPSPGPLQAKEKPDREEAMRDFFEKQREWSYETFGPPSFKGPKGPLDHLKKEAAEAFDETDPERQKVEIVDCLFLTFDAAHRAGMTFADLVRVANEKMAKNQARTWPDWRGTDPDKAIEHDRSKDAPSSLPQPPSSGDGQEGDREDRIVKAGWEEWTARERDRYIDQRIMGQGWVTEDGTPCPRPDDWLPRYTASASDDYEVLKRVRETWEQDRGDRFGQALFGIWDDRYPEERLKSGVEGFYYRPGDYSWAAYLALTSEKPDAL